MPQKAFFFAWPTFGSYCCWWGTKFFLATCVVTYMEYIYIAIYIRLQSLGFCISKLSVFVISVNCCVDRISPLNFLNRRLAHELVKIFINKFLRTFFQYSIDPASSIKTLSLTSCPQNCGYRGSSCHTNSTIVVKTPSLMLRIFEIFSAFSYTGCTANWHSCENGHWTTFVVFRKFVPKEA